MNNTYLSIDTTTEACSVALSSGSDSIFRYTEEPRQHANLVLPMVEELLSEAGYALQQIDGIVFCRGPGAFTGLRIGAGVVQGLAFSVDVPVVGVSTLATIAQRAWREQGVKRVHAAIDARMGEVYWGSYVMDEEGVGARMNLHGSEQVAKPQAIVVEAPVDDAWAGCGTGWVFSEDLKNAGIIVDAIHSEMLPHAVDALALGIPGFSAGLGVSAELAIPQYIRNNVAKKKAEQGPAL